MKTQKSQPEVLAGDKILLVEGLTADLSRQKKEAANLKIG